MHQLTLVLSIYAIFFVQCAPDYQDDPKHRPSESERVDLWYREGNTWPPQWQEESEGYKRTMHKWEEEIMSIDGSQERWENWMQLTQGQMVPKFTRKGFDIVNTPPSIHSKLAARVKEGLGNWESLPLEDGGDGIYGPQSPKFIDLGGLDWTVIDELTAFHEAWVDGMKLVPTSAYGVRMYQNGSSMIMHYDKVHSHVISSIVHIAHKYDNESHPWPLEIVDHDGQVHSVTLEEGQTLFYESAKCLHGRLKEFRGQYYGSIFLHYKPVDTNIWSYTYDEVIASVPPHWMDNTTDDTGSRWAGQGLTIDSLAAAGSKARIVAGEYVHDNKSPHAYHPGEGPLEQLGSEL